MEPWLVVFIGLQLLFFSLLIWIVVHYRIEKSRQRSEERIRLLDRFQSAAELEGFLASESGRTYLNASAIWRFEPRLAVLICLAAGFVCFAVGLGVLILVVGPSGFDEMALPGTVFTSLGVGLFLAAGVSSVLVRVWRLGADNQS